MKRFIGRYIGIITSVAILAVVISLIDLQKVLVQLKNADTTLLLLALLLTLPQLGLRAYRWYFLLRLQKINCGFRDAVIYYVAGMYIGMFTPGRVGEASKALFLKAGQKSSFSRSMSSVFVDRILDIYVLLGCVVLVALGSDFFEHFNLNRHYFYLTAIVFLFISISPKIIQVVFKRIGDRILKQFSKGWMLMIDEFFQGLEALLKPPLIFAGLLTVAHYALFFFQAHIIAQSVGIEVPFFSVLKVVSIAMLVGFVPATFAGLGTRDAAFVFLFQSFGVAKASGLGFAVAFDVICIFGFAVIGMVVCWFIPFNVHDLLMKRSYR